MRNIIEIAGQLKDMIESQQAKENIQRVINSAEFTAPEAMYLRWNHLQEVVFDSLPEDEKQWNEHEISIVSVFSTVPVDEIKRQIRRQ